MNLLLVTPFGCDPEFKEKHVIVNDLCHKNNFNLLSINEKSSTNLNATLSIDIYRDCDVAIVDLTMERPSCYYELGFLEALRKRLFLVAKAGTIIHQTLNKDKIHIYESIPTYKSVISSIITELLL